LRNLAPTDRQRRRIEALLRLEALGGKVLPVTADVSNIEEMQDARLQIETELGPIRGVVHAAGVVDDAPILAKSPVAIEDVFTAKIHGTEVLAQLFPEGALEFMALFSSSSTVTAPAGQVDYVAANEFLNAFAKSRAGSGTNVVAINWGVWSGVGMAADAMQARTGGAPAPVTDAGQPLLTEASFDGAGARTYRGALSTEDWILDEHRTLDGTALIPGTGYLSIIAQALAAQGEGSAFELYDLNFLRPFHVGPRDEAGAVVTMTRNAGGYDIEIAKHIAGAAPEVTAEGRIDILPMRAPAPLDLGEIRARCGAAEVAPEGGSLVSPQEAHLRFGPRWRVLQRRATGDGEGLAHLALPPAAAQDDWPLHPALMDLATGWAMELIAGYEPDHLWVPVAYQSVRVYAPLPGRVVSWAQSAPGNRASGETATFDVTIADTDGQVLVEVRGFSIRKLAGALQFKPPAPLAAAGPAALSPAEERLKHNISQGIRPGEGAQLFARAMASGRSQIVISSLDLAGLVAQADASAEQDEAQAGFERPNLDSDFAPPENEIEAKLAGFWQELLGIGEVGVEDSFFDLGGHSLIAVRLFAKVKKAFGVDFPISVLFEAPTIRACAALLAERGVTAGGDADEARATAAPEQRRFVHLVPMHQGEGGPKTPFFLVAGMFGNVLNLRHLAHLIGTDRPFYGLQARGLFGDAEPHRDLTGAAADMIAEMRAVQPQGPYLVGGFSGGGITAYEIARQLTEAGEEIAVLAMLDTPLPQRRPLSRRDKNMIHWLELKKQGPAYPFRWVADKIRYKLAGSAEAEADEGGAFHDAAIEAAFYDAIARYQVHDWSGPLTLFRPPLVGHWQVAPGRWISSERAYVLPDNDWTGHAPGIEVVEVPGDHDSMVLEPNVRVLAARLRRVIEAAEDRAAAPTDHSWETREAAQ